MRVILGPFRKKGNRTIKVRIDGYDCWNANHSIAVIALPLLKRFKERAAGHPWQITMEEWNKILDQMIWSMQMVVEEKDCIGSTTKVKNFYRKLQKGFELFGKYFQSLWY